MVVHHVLFALRSGTKCITKRVRVEKLSFTAGPIAAHQAGMNVELLSADSQRVIVRVRKLVAYLSSSQATSKTAKLPKAQRVPPHEKIYQQGCCWQIFFCFGGARDHS